MNNEQIMSLGVCVGSFGIYCSMLTKAFGMHAENQMREAKGESPAFVDEHFEAVIAIAREGAQEIGEAAQEEANAKDK